MAVGVPKKDWPHLTNSERRKIEVLQRRADWLRKRIEEKGYDYDKHELSSIEWALGKISALDMKTEA